MLKTAIPAEINGISAGLDFIEESLEKFKFKPKHINEAMLLSEESMVRLIDCASEGDTIDISVKRKRGIARITLSAPGSEFSNDAAVDFNLSEGKLDRGSENTIRGILLKAFESKMRYSRKGQYNFVQITAGVPEKVFAFFTAGSLILAIILGLLMRALLPGSVQSYLDQYIFSPVQQIFIRLLMLCTAPAVFFSIITGVARYSSFSDPGRVSIKVFISFALTSVLAILIGYGTSIILKPGVPGALQGITEYASGSAGYAGFVDTLVNIVPPNIVDPFLNMDTLQLVFTALVCGIALGRVGNYSTTLCNIIEALNTLFTKFADILMNFIPLATFASTVSLIFNLGGHILLSLLEMLGALIVAIALMTLAHCLIIGIVARVNPITCFKKFGPNIQETFLLSSGIAALPKNMRCCKNSLGVSPKVYSFSMPFGASVNMDGNCIYLTIAGLFLARLCGVSFFGNDVLPLIFSVFVLSVGAPITKGSVLLCLTVLLSQLGVSLSALSLLIGINALVEMLLAASDTMGDVAVTLAVAKSENLLDTDVYNSKPKIRK